MAAAGDLALLASNTASLQLQMKKVDAFACWAGMELAPAKCEASAILWGAHASCPGVAATDWGVIQLQPVLSQLCIHGCPLECTPPNEPLKYLGVLLTLTMDWRPHLGMLLDMVASRGSNIARAPASIAQKVEVERHAL